jgi:hypothetical protein
MTRKKTDGVLGYVFYFIFIVIFISVGFYFGYKNAEATFTDPEFIANSLKESEIIPNLEQNNLTNIPLEEDDETKKNVLWVKINEEPTCPPTHPIKGKFTNSANVYYTKENNFYNRVVPHICFSSEEYAREIAGFIKKF